MAVTQLQLPMTPNRWKLDHSTIHKGKTGVARAREILASCQSREDELLETRAALAALTTASTTPAPLRQKAASTSKHVLAA